MLEELGIPLTLLLFERGKEYPMPRIDTPIRTLALALPPSLVKLRLYALDEWQYCNWEKESRDFSEKKSKYTPKLIYVWIEYWISAEEEKRPESIEEEEERVRKTLEMRKQFEEMSEEAQDVGINLDIFLCGSGRSLYR